MQIVSGKSGEIRVAPGAGEIEASVRLIVALARAINTALIILLRRQTRAWDTIGSAVYPSYEVYSQFERLPKRHRFTHLLHSACPPPGDAIFNARQRRRRL